MVTPRPDSHGAHLGLFGRVFAAAGMGRPKRGTRIETLTFVFSRHLGAKSTIR